MKERTLKETVRIQGLGVHSGRVSTIYLHPEEEGGIRFIQEGTVIPAAIDSVGKIDRGVVLSKEGRSIYTVEHLLAALFACQVEHLLIQVEGVEVPALDGSAYPFITAMEKVGFKNLKKDKRKKYIKSSYLVEEKGCFAYLRPARELQIHYIISYDHPMLSYQEYRFNRGSDFNQEIARARTYGFLSWKEDLRSKGYALGSSMDNTLVYDEGGLVNEARFPDEAVRHKVLDLIGDLYLKKPFPIGSYLIFRGGHDLHFKLLKKIERSE
ncbi:MAG: UDP-3-O-acyl-N-acetylglucosamine deacetylase [candidate division WOR-3 bacterium]|nr:UDP-3-O-acyl-N-acetylglucosamine deacetylase [candidate division WOR-3 bacterium]